MRNGPISHRSPDSLPNESGPSPGAAPEGRPRVRRITVALMLLTLAILLGSNLAMASGGPGPAASAPRSPLFGAGTSPGLAVATVGTPNPAAVASAPLAHSAVPTVPLSSFPIVPLSAWPVASAPSTSPNALTPRPLGASTASNWFVQNYGQAGNLIQVGGSNRSIAVAGTSVSDVFNISTGSTWYQTHGFTTVATSKDGGTSWVVSWPGQASNWTASGSPNLGDILGWPILDPAYSIGVSPFSQTRFYGFQPDPPVLRDTPNGNTMILLSPFANSCFLYYTSTCQTNYITTFGAGEGVAAAVSTNGGTGWANPVPIMTAPFLHVYTTTAACGNYAAGGYLVPGTEISSLGLSLNTYGDAVAAFTLTHFEYASSQLLICNTTVSPNVLQYNWNGIDFTSDVSVSTNSGSTWSAPQVRSEFNWSSSYLATGIPYTPLFNNAHLTVGPAPSETVSLVYTDLSNGTAYGEEPFMMTTSSNNGSTWSTPTDIAGIGEYVVIASNPAWFLNETGASIASDNWSSSSHKGNLYLTWNDNRSTSSPPQSPGYPSIAFSRNTGTSWSSTVYVSTNNPGSLYYFNPSISVGASGAVWITYYGVNPSNGNYHVYGVFSSDGGSTWSSQFVISDAASLPGSSPNSLPIFGYASSAVTSAGTYVGWEDCRAVDCTFAGGNTSTFVALVHPLTISSSATGISATVTVGGVASTDPLPAHLGVDQNASLTISVPTWVATPNGTYIDEFVGFTGAVTSSSDPVTFLYAGGNVSASYSPTPGSWITGTLAPLITGAKLTIVQLSSGQSVTATLTAGSSSYGFNVTVPGGSSYSVTGSAPNYQPATFTGGTMNFQELQVHLTLMKETGTIVGSVSLSTGTAGLGSVVLTLNGTVVPNAVDASTGRFSLTEPWGDYAVQVNSTPASAYVGCLANIVVQPGGSAAMSCGLKGSWINGTVTPFPVTVTINGVAVSLNANGAQANWIAALPGGFYWVNASEAGYSSYHMAFTVKAGQSLSLSGAQAIVLTNRGTVTGVISPTQNAQNFPILKVNGQTYPVLTSGSYSVSIVVTPGLTTVVVSLTGYNTSYNNVTLAPGNTSWLNITLEKTPPQGCQGTNCPPPPPCNQTGTCTNGGGGSTTQGLPLFDYVGIGLIVVIVIIAAILLLTRRGGRGAAPMPPPMTSAAPPAEGSSEMAGEPSAPGTDGASPPTGV